MRVTLGNIVLWVVFAGLLWVVAFRRRPTLALAQRTAGYLKEVRGEVSKVTWPGWNDLRQSTVVIIIFVILIGILIGLMDWIFSKLLIDLLGQVFR